MSMFDAYVRALAVADYIDTADTQFRRWHKIDVEFHEPSGFLLIDENTQDIKMQFKVDDVAVTEGKIHNLRILLKKAKLRLRNYSVVRDDDGDGLIVKLYVRDGGWW